MHLVLLPGADGTGELFAPLIEALRPESRATVVGYSAQQVCGYAELTAYVRTRLPTEEAFALVAESFSGPIAIKIAASPPLNMKGLVLCASFALNPNPIAMKLGMAMAPLAIALARSPAIWPFVLGRYYSTELAERIRNAIRKNETAVLIHRFREIAKINALEEVKQIALPTIYLQASADLLVPANAGLLICAANPDIELRPIDAPHFLLQSNPAVSARAIESFCQSLDVSDAPAIARARTT